MSHKPNVEETISQQLTAADQTLNGAVVFLDHKLSNSEARINDEVKKVLTCVIQQAITKPYRDFYYRVDFGPGIRPQYHIVTHDFWCCCALGSDCAAVIAVRMYLRDGGEPANIPRLGYFPICPHVCPICGSMACYAPELSSKHRGIGWHCSRHGASHYWQHQGSLHRIAYVDKSVSK